MNNINLSCGRNYYYCNISSVLILANYSPISFYSAGRGLCKRDAKGYRRII